jgi:hypothetical protein
MPEKVTGTFTSTCVPTGFLLSYYFNVTILMSVSVLTVLRNRYFPPQQKKSTEYLDSRSQWLCGSTDHLLGCGFEFHLVASMSLL